MEKVFFEPWVGKDYETGGRFGKRVMVLGDSHYCGNECDDCGSIHHKGDCSGITVEVVETFLNPERDFETWMPTFTKFERAVNNKELSQTEKEQFWNSIIFYNYLQEAIGGPRIEPNINLYSESFEPFIEVLEKYKPDTILVWGQRLFKALPPGNGKEGISLDIDGNLYDKSWIYTLSNGKQVKLYAIDHPSSAFSWEYWHPIIKAAIEI